MIGENYLKFQNGNSRDIITWVFCEDCYREDESKREIPNYMTEEVDIVKVDSDFDGPTIKFNCPKCKEAKRPWKKESRVQITANEFQAHPFLDPDYDPSNSDLSDEFLYENFQEQLDIAKFVKDNE
jgi:hypothetical protein